MDRADHSTNQPVQSSCYMRQRNKEASVAGEGGQGRRRQGQAPLATFATVGTLDFTLVMMRNH